MKTIKEWLEELPEPHRSRALRNADKKHWHIEANSMEKAIAGICVWSKSPEGFFYWREISQGNYSAKPPYETTEEPPAKPRFTETKRVITALVITAAVLGLTVGAVYAAVFFAKAVFFILMALLVIFIVTKLYTVVYKSIGPKDREK